MAPINVGSLKDQPPCRHCGAFLWPSETSNVCCKNGALFDKTRPLESPMKVMDDPPPEIIELVTKPSLSRYISHYNNSLAMASIGGEFPETNATIRLQGKMYHSLGSLAPPPPGQRPKFASIYFYDTDHEVEHRQAHMSRTPLQPGILATLQSLLKEVNPYVRSFKAALEVYGPREDVKFVILSTAEKKEKQRDVHPGCLSLPQGSEVGHFKGKEMIGSRWLQSCLERTARRSTLCCTSEREESSRSLRPTAPTMRSPTHCSILTVATVGHLA